MAVRFCEELIASFRILSLLRCAKGGVSMFDFHDLIDVLNLCLMAAGLIHDIISDKKNNNSKERK